VAQEVWGTEVLQRGTAAEPLVGSGGGGEAPESSQHITDIWLPDRHNFVYLGKLHEPLVKHGKNLGCSACLFAELSSD